MNNHNTIKGIVLAAGRGSRLLGLTDDRPKGLVPLNGNALVEWQIAAMKQVGIEDVSVVTGYLPEKFDRLGLQTINNPDWHATNMVGSLMCVLDKLNSSFLISYSDIVCQKEVIASLLSAKSDIAISYDTAWLELWSRRFDDPLSDAESFKIDSSGFITEIGQEISSLDEVQGQFMGLIKLTENGVEQIRSIIASNPDYRAKLDMTTLLNLLIKAGQRVEGVPIHGGWCEVDNQDDLKVAEALVRSGDLVLSEPLEMKK